MRPFTVLAVTLGLALAGCGGSAADDTTTAPAENPGAPAKKPAGTKSKTTITMRDIQFKPKSITVKVGDTVRWVNEDPLQHNVVAQSGANFSSELFDQNGTYRYKTTQAGTIKYVCTVHPGMEGTIVVK